MIVLVFSCNYNRRIKLELFLFFKNKSEHVQPEKRKLSCAKKFFVLGLATGRAKSVFGLVEAKNAKMNIIVHTHIFK